MVRWILIVSNLLALAGLDECYSTILTTRKFVLVWRPNAIQLCYVARGLARWPFRRTWMQAYVIFHRRAYFIIERRLSGSISQPSFMTVLTNFCSRVSLKLSSDLQRQFFPHIKCDRIWFAHSDVVLYGELEKISMSNSHRNSKAHMPMWITSMVIDLIVSIGP